MNSLVVRSTAGQMNNPALLYLSRLAKKSRVTVVSCLSRVAGALGYPSVEDFPWRLLRREHVVSIMEVLSQANLAPATINLYLSILKGVSEEAWLLGSMDTDSYQRIKAIKGARGSRIAKGRALSKDERIALLRACDDGTAVGKRDAAIFAVLVGCGLRRSEAAYLLLSDVDMETRTIVLIGKGNKERRAFMPTLTHQVMSEWLRVREQFNTTGYLFLRARRFGKETRLVESGLTSQAIYYILGQRQQKAGIRPFSPHDLRRTYATMLFENNEDLITVQNMMGHASIATTQRYDMRGEEVIKEAVSNLDVI